MIGVEQRKMGRGILTLYKGGIYEAKLLMSFRADMAESSNMHTVSVDNDGAGYPYKIFIENYKTLVKPGAPVFIYVKHKLPPKSLVDAIKYLLMNGTDVSMIACTDGMLLESMADVIYCANVTLSGRSRVMKVSYDVLKNRLNKKLRDIV